MEIKFAELLTKALETSSPQYVTRLPKCILTAAELKYVDYLNQCSEQGWIPSLETFKREFRFIELKTEIPPAVLYDKFAKQRRNKYIAEKISEFVEKNRTEGRDAYEGLAEYNLELLDKTVISNPQVIDYGNLPRESYVKNVYRSSYHLPHFDGISTGLQGGDFIVIMAGTKGYKTTLLKALAHGAYTQGNENIVFCSQEQAPLAMAQQMDMHQLGRTHSHLRAGISEDQMEELKKFQRRLGKRTNKFYITPPVKSVRQLHEYIVSLNCPVHKVLIDGLNLMQGDFSDNYGSLQKVCAELKQYAIDHNMIIIAVTQSNREGYKASMNMGAQHIAGSFAIAMYADVMLALSTIEENKKPYVYIRPILNRHGDLSTKISMLVDYKKDGRFGLAIGILDPDYSPEDTVISYQTSKQLRTQFKEETGLEWSAVKQSVGSNSANALEKFLMEDSGLTELDGVINELTQDPF